MTAISETALLTTQSRPAMNWRIGMTGPLAASRRMIAEETPIALTYDGSTHAVMMATPANLEEFALGFSLCEGIISEAGDIQSLDIVNQPTGVELRMWLSRDRGQTLSRRRRHLAGPTGCGLCGLESLDQVARVLPSLPCDVLRFDAAGVAEAMGGLRARQPLHHETGAVHAAALWVPGQPGLMVREDVGRHNALDKLVGAALLAGVDTQAAAVLLTSRVSVELVQKTARLGARLLVAVSAPTALAIQTAEDAGITLVAVARDDGFQVFTHAHRIATAPAAQ